MSESSRVELRWTREELEPHFGALGGKKAWHRLEERISKLNLDGKRYGVRIVASQDEGILTVSAKQAQTLEAFREKLDAAPGRVQRSFGKLIASGTGGGGPQAMGQCVDRQREAVARRANEPLKLFSDLAPLPGSVFIDPPFRWGDAPGKGGALQAVLSEAASPSGGSMIVVGPSGIGKSTLAGEAFRRLQSAPGAGWSHPLFVPASDVQFGPSGEVEWEKLPGVPAGLGGRLETLFKEGRLLLILDGLDENLRLQDLSNPAAWSFWGMASRNRCILTCRDRFYNYRFAFSPVERIFGGGLKIMSLPAWGPAEAKALFGGIAERGQGAPKARSLVEGLTHLSRLPPDFLREKMASFQITGLTAWNFAVYFALHNKGKFPRNEYEILEYFVEQTLRWEKGKTREGDPLPVEILRGLLVRLGRSADGERNGRKSWRVTPDAILEVVGRYYPFLLERKVQLFAELRRIPFLEYEPETGAFHLDYRLGCYFAAKNVVVLGLQGDAAGLREECLSPMSFQSFNFLIQAFAGFDDDSRRKFFESAKRVFEDVRRDYERDKSERLARAMCELFEPLGCLGSPEAGEFLREISARPGDFPELVNFNCARGIAYAGDRAAVDAYVRRLKKDRAARRFNSEYYLHSLWLSAEYTIQSGRGDQRRVSLEKWERQSRWFVQKLTTDDYKDLRHIQLYTFTDLLRTLGSGSLERGALRGVAESLRRESSEWSAGARADLAEFTKLSGRLDPA